MIETQKEIEKIWSVIQNSQSFLVLGHKNVDGDAYGSSMAIYFYLTQLGKYAEVVNELPVTSTFFFLNVHEFVKNEIREKKFDAIFVCDSGDYSLIGKLTNDYRDIFKNTPIINIDHHSSNPSFGTYNLIDTEASSTCEIVYDLLKNLWARFDKQISTLLLLGIIRDTNCFKNSIRPRTFEMTSELLSFGAEYAKIIFETYRREKYNYLEIYGYILSNLIIFKWGRIIGGVITQELFKQYGILESDFGPQFINETLSAIDGADFVFLITETESGENKLGFRARREGCDVSRIAQQFGGGWHIKSAGARTKLPIEEILRIIEETES